MFICLPPGHPRCRWLCFFSRTQIMIFNFSRCSLSVYNACQWSQNLWERKKTCTEKSKLNPAACDDTLMCKDTKRSVCARNWTVFICFFKLLELSWALSQQQEHEASSSSSCFMADCRLISALPPPISQMDHWHYLQSQLGASMVRLRDRWR